MEDTVNKSLWRARRITVEHEIPKGSLVIGIQKGWSVNEGVLLILAVSAFITGQHEPPVTEHAHVSVDSPEMASYILSGMHPYDAYEKAKGVSIRKTSTPVYEVITGKSEIVWMETTIRKVLDAFQKQKSDSC